MGVHSTLFGPVKYAILPAAAAARRSSSAATASSRWARSSRSCSARSLGGVLVAIAGCGPPCSPARPTIAVAVAGWLVEPPHSRRRPRSTPELAINWNPFTETWQQPALRARQPRRLALDARHLVVLVLRRDSSSRSSPSFAQRRPRRRRARRHAAARAVLGRHRRRLAAVRAPVGATRSRSASCRSARSASPSSRSTCGSRRRGMHATALAGIEAFLASRRTWRVAADLVLIGLFGGFYIVPLYALIQERSRARAPLAHHRRQQHPERALHGGVGAGSRIALLARRARRSRSSSSSRRS